MALGAVFLVNRHALGGEIFVDFEWIGRRGEVAQPIGDAFQARPIPRRRRNAGAHRRAAIALFQRDIVAVPV